MNLLTLLEMAATGMPARVAVGRTGTPELGCSALTYPGLLDRVRAGAATLRDLGADELVYLGVNTDDFPTALFAAAWAGIPLVPLNYRLSSDSLATLLAHHRDALGVSDLQPPTGANVLSIAQWRTACARPAGDMPRWADDADVVVILVDAGPIPLLIELAVVGRCRGNGCPAQVPRSCPVGRAGFGSPHPWPVAVPGTRPSVIGYGLVGSSHDAILWSRACHTFPSPHWWPWARRPTTVAAARCRVTFFDGVRAGTAKPIMLTAKRFTAPLQYQ